MRGKYERPRTPLSIRIIRFLNLLRVRSGLRVLFSALLLLCCLITWETMNRSTAWYVQNKHVTANQSQVQIQDLDPVQATVTVHSLVTGDGQTLTFSANGTEVTDGNLAFAMPTYNLWDTGDRHILLRICLSEEVRGLDLTAYTNTDYFMDEAHPLLDGNGYGDDYVNAMTSIIKFAAVTPADTDTGWAVAIPAAGDYASFVSYVDGVPTVNPRTLVLAEDFGTEVSLLISYDETLIDTVYENNIGSTVLVSEVGEEKTINYVMDFVFQLLHVNP